MQNFLFWGATASPFQLKMQSMMDYYGHSWKRAPDHVSISKALVVSARLKWAKSWGKVRRHGGMKRGLDEYPSVPFYSLDAKTFYYDSTSLAWHLDNLESNGAEKLLPEKPVLRFLAQLIDEAVDEFGLYMVHHNRWVISAATNTMGEATAREAKIPDILNGYAARHLARRQSQRCPYLFSVAPDDFDAGVDKAITPPARPGFPPTHDLLNSAWRKYLWALEEILNAQPYILGDRFTLADASIYGQFSMNLVDGRANELLQQHAPTTHAWLCHIRDGGHQKSVGEVRFSPVLSDLLSLIGDTFIPLMKQNHAAWARQIEAGETLFNEAAFNEGRSLYDGELMGYPFRHVVKTFQVSVWEDLIAAWRALSESEQKQLLEWFPANMHNAFSEEAWLNPEPRRSVKI